MGQKIHPVGFRLAVTRKWWSRWYATGKNFSKLLVQDIQIRNFLKQRLKAASVGHILIERPAKDVRITIYSARPGIVIGRKGEEIEFLKTELQKMMQVPVHLSIEEIRKPELDAQLIADSITQQLEKRVMFRRVMKRAISNAMRLGVLGIKIMSSGRLNGIEIARVEWYREGRVPLHTLRANIDYAGSEAKTTYGIIGVKVWVYLGDQDAVLPVEESQQDDKRANRRDAGGPGRKFAADPGFSPKAPPGTRKKNDAARKNTAKRPYASAAKPKTHLESKEDATTKT